MQAAARDHLPGDPSSPPTELAPERELLGGATATRSSWGEAPVPPSGLPTGLASALAACDSARGGSGSMAGVGCGACRTRAAAEGPDASWGGVEEAEEEAGTWAEDGEGGAYGLAAPELDGGWDDAQLGGGFPHVVAAPLSESCDFAGGGARARELSSGGGVSHATYTVTATTPAPLEMRPRVEPLAAGQLAM